MNYPNCGEEMGMYEGLNYIFYICFKCVSECENTADESGCENTADESGCELEYDEGVKNNHHE